jgi:anaerobic magnesium-protoporphyrin IX monomethyl ester cyclase
MSNILLISYDNGSHLPVFPMNIFYLMGALKRKGHNVGVWFQDVHHQEDKFISEILNESYFDVVGLGFVAGYYPYRKIKSLTRFINKHKDRKEINLVLGGHGPAGAPEFFLKKMKADTVVVGDGEKAICDIASNNSKGVIHSDSESLDYPDLSCYESFPIDIYRLNRPPMATNTDFCMPILSSRGCKWNCSFCYRMRDGFHERPVAAIIKEISYLHRLYGINYFDFEDELLMASVKRTEGICEGISKLPFKIKWDCNGRLNYAKPDILKLMKKAGCEYINYGIESLNQTILNQMGKGLTLNQIHSGVQNTLAAGLSPGLNLLWGFPENTEADLLEEVEFLKKYCPGDELRTIRPVTPYPGCPLFEKGKKDGLVKDAEDFYENLHVNSDLISVNFMDIPNERAHRVLYEANEALITNYYSKKLGVSLAAAKDLYINNNTEFRGFRAV